MQLPIQHAFSNQFDDRMPHSLSGQVVYKAVPGVAEGPHLLVDNLFMHFETYDINLVRVFFTAEGILPRVAPPQGMTIRRDNGDRDSVTMDPLGIGGMYFLLSRNHNYDILLHGVLTYRLSDSHTLQVHKFI